MSDSTPLLLLTENWGVTLRFALLLLIAVSGMALLISCLGPLGTSGLATAVAAPMFKKAMVARRRRRVGRSA